MRRARRALTAVWSILTVAGVTVAGGMASASAGAAGAAAPLGGRLLGVSCTSATACMAVGSAGGPNFNADLLADRWNGATWSVVPVPKPPHAKSGDLASISCTAPTACMAVGNYQTKRVFKPLAERWNGTTWSLVPMPQGGFAPDLFGVSCATNSCAAVGCYIDVDRCHHSVAYEWNGTAWRLQPATAGIELDAVSCTAPSACMAVGNRNNGTLTERWIGQKWFVARSPNPPKNGTLIALAGVSCLATGCEAVGSYTTNRNRVVTLALRWNGHAWSIQKSPNPPGPVSQVFGVSCSASSACTAVGSYFDNNTGQKVTTALRWNGTAWAVQAPGNPHTKPFVSVMLSGVSCPAAASCTTVGNNVFGSQGASRALAEGWNGIGWAIEPTPAPAH
jgi:hypothetical protein